MININLLPIPQQKALKTRYWLRLSILITIGLIVLLVWLSISFLILNSFWYSEFGAVQKNVDEELEMLEKKFNNFNQQLSFISQLPINPHFKILNTINSLQPYGIKLLNINSQGAELKIKGHAIERQILLNFQEALEQEFPKIISPLDNLVKSKDLEFNLTIKLNDD